MGHGSHPTTPLRFRPWRRRASDPQAVATTSTGSSRGTSRRRGCTPSVTTPWGSTTPSGWPRRSGPAGSRGARSSRPRSRAPRSWTACCTGWPSTGSPTPSAESGSPHDGFFAGVPSFVKDNSDVAGLPTQQGSRAWVAEPARGDGDFARMYSADRHDVLGKTRLSEFGFSPSAEYRLTTTRAQPVAHRPHLGRLLGGLGGVRRLRRGADVARQRRRRLDPDPGRLLRPGRAQADAGPDARRTSSAARCRCRSCTTAWSPARSATPPRSCASPSGSTATSSCLRSATSRGPGTAAPAGGVMVDSIGGRVSDDDTRATVLQTARLLEDLGHTVEEVPVPDVGRFADDFLLYWASTCALPLAHRQAHLQRAPSTAAAPTT